MSRLKRVTVPVVSTAFLVSSLLLITPVADAAKKVELKFVRSGAVKLKLRLLVKKPALSRYYKGLFRNRIVVKFKEGAKVRTAANRKVRLITRVSKLRLQLMKLNRLNTKGIKADIGKFNAILKRGAVARFKPLFSRRTSALDTDRKAANKATGVQHADLGNYYSIVLKKGQKGEQLVNEINKLPSVEIAYLAPIGKDADIPPKTPSYDASQGYLNPAPTGIDARYAWRFKGGTGPNIRIIDIEQGWTLNHEDLRKEFFKDGKIMPTSKNHGTAVLGQMVAKRDGSGVTGISYNASHGVVSARRIKTTGIEYNAAEAINVAASKLRKGDIILIEQHAKGPDSGKSCKCNCKQHEYIAMEYWQAEYDAIKAATAKGIIVVEAAGNGGMNLDASRYNNRFKRSFRDSGAIIVGASTAKTRKPMCWTNYGSRVDVHAWGEKVMTLGYGDIKVNGSDQRQWYTKSFGGTSSASPIVAGAVAVIQGIRKAHRWKPLSAKAMRKFMRKYGTRQARSKKHIGPMPNLRRMIGRMNVKPRPDCVSFNPMRVTVAKKRGKWKIIEGSHWIMSFKRKKNAQKARKIIRHYRVNKYCFVERPKPGMTYFLKGKKPPRGKFRGEDCIRIDPASLKIKRQRRKWKLIGRSIHFSFKYREAAKEALGVIRQYKFRYSCFVKRPNPGMKYLRQ